MQKCKLRLKTGADNPIPQDSVLHLSCSTGIKFIPDPGSTDLLSEMTISLPAISQSCDWSECLLVYLPSIYNEPNILMSEDEFYFSTSKPPTAWNHEVSILNIRHINLDRIIHLLQIVVSCQWLMPPYIATLPITSPEPLIIDHRMCCTPDRFVIVCKFLCVTPVIISIIFILIMKFFLCTFRSFLQFTVTSNWPKGVKLGEEKLSVPKSVSSESMQVLTPEVS